MIEVPGASLSAQEWRDIRLARLSFVAMWGGGDGSGVFERDRLDGRGDDAAIYDAKHYLARVDDGTGPAKLVTSRKVLIRPDGMTSAEREEPGPLLPLDIRFWRDDATVVPLWFRLRTYARNLAPDDELAEFRIASMGRVATHPFGECHRSALRRAYTAVAWAATQVLAAHDDPSLLWMWTICWEFRDKVMVVHDGEGRAVQMPFVRTDEALGLPIGSVVLDRDMPVVERTMMAAPGYFFDNRSAGRVLAALLDEGRVTIADLQPAIGRLVEWEAGAGRAAALLDELLSAMAAADPSRLAEMLTRPRSMKYLIPVMTGAEPLTKMTTTAFRRVLLNEVADGPFSACVGPRAWSAAAWSMLEAASAGQAAAPAGRPSWRSERTYSIASRACSYNGRHSRWASKMSAE